MTGGRNCWHSLMPVIMILGIAIAFLACGCMWGFVKDTNTGAGISGATVKYTDSDGYTGTTTTNANGWYAFDQAKTLIPAAGPVTLEVSAPGYSSAIMPRLVEYNDNPNATLSNPSSF